MTKPIMVREEIKLDLNYMPLSLAIKNLQETMEKYGDLDISLEIIDEFDYSRAIAIIELERPENEREKAERLARIKRVEDYELQQYKLLKAKYEGK